MELPFIITQLIFWKLLFYLIIYCIFGLIALFAKSTSNYSWYGFKNHTFIGAIFQLTNYIWVIVPLVFLFDFIHLVINWIF